MTEGPGRSRYLRRGYLTPTERVRYEVRGSKWYFFTWPSAWLLGALLGDYWLALAAGASVPAVPLLSYPGTHTVPSHLSLALTAALFALLVLWLVARLHHLTRLARRSPAEPLTHQGRSARFHYLVPPAFFLVLATLALVGVGVSTGSSTAGWASAHRATLGLSALGLGRVIYAVLTALLVLWLIVRWAEWVGDSYVVTEDRLIKEHARWTVFGRLYDDREIQIRQVRDIDLYQSRILWKALRIGTLNIHSLSEIPSGPDPGDGPSERPGRVDPYPNPELGIHEPGNRSIDNSPGVEWWFAIPDPLRAQREIEEANHSADGGRRPGA